MKNTPLRQLLQYAKSAHFGVIDREMLIEEIESLFEDEQEMVVAAWIEGNRQGWEMNTDWPEDAEKYFNDKYLQK